MRPQATPTIRGFFKGADVAPGRVSDEPGQVPSVTMMALSHPASQAFPLQRKGDVVQSVFLKSSLQ